jgi:2-polyprenyl-3-methyl-5-hydroxy-6-metoxy-1,4-benzoquinol methylase
LKSILFPSSSATIVQSYSSEELIRKWKETYNIDITKEFDQVDTVSEFRCDKSGLFFYSPESAAGGGKFYEDLQHFEWYYKEDKWEHKKTLKQLKKDECVLEVGCGKGWFVKKCLEVGINCKGIELNEKAVKCAEKEGLPVFSIDLTHFSDLYAGTFDCVVAFQVLEHVCNPREFIASCLKLLKVNGTLVFAVPNSDVSLIRQFNLLNMPPHHMLGWNKSAFKSLEQIFPIKLKEIELEPLADYHIGWYLGSLRRNNFFVRQLFKLSILHNFFSYLLRKGLNKLVVGHSIMVSFQKNEM